MFYVCVWDQSEHQSLCPPLQVELRALIESSEELLRQGALCPKLLWHEYRRLQVRLCRTSLINVEQQTHLSPVCLPFKSNVYPLTVWQKLQLAVARSNKNRRLYLTLNSCPAIERTLLWHWAIVGFMWGLCCFGRGSPAWSWCTIFIFITSSIWSTF